MDVELCQPLPSIYKIGEVQNSGFSVEQIGGKQRKIIEQIMRTCEIDESRWVKAYTSENGPAHMSAVIAFAAQKLDILPSRLVAFVNEGGVRCFTLRVPWLDLSPQGFLEVKREWKKFSKAVKLLLNTHISMTEIKNKDYMKEIAINSLLTAIDIAATIKDAELLLPPSLEYGHGTSYPWSRDVIVGEKLIPFLALGWIPPVKFTIPREGDFGFSLVRPDVIRGEPELVRYFSLLAESEK